MQPFEYVFYHCNCERSLIVVLKAFSRAASEQATILKSGVLCIAAPLTVIALSNVFNSAGLSTAELVCWGASSIMGLALIGAGLKEGYQNIWAPKTTASAQLSRPFP
jgi:hypothetical protein